MWRSEPDMSWKAFKKEAVYHYTGLHDHATYVKFSPYPIRGFERKA